MLTDAAAGRVFRALADPTRRLMLRRLAEAEYGVSELARAVGVSQPAATKHLAVLADAGLVRQRDVGRVRYSRLDPAGFAPTTAWIDACRALWNERLDALAALMDDLTREEHDDGERG